MDAESITAWAQDNGVAGSYAELAENPKVIALFQGYFDQLNQGLGSWESVKKFAILPEDFTPENGLLTPSLKVKRKKVEETYMDILDSFYEDALASV